MIKKLKEVAKVNEISISSKSYPANIYYIDIASVDNGFITAAQEIKFSEAPTRARRIVKNKDILLSTVRPNLRHYAFVQNAKDNTIASTGFAVISCKNINPRFLYYFLTSNNVTDYLSAIAESHTSTYPSFPPEILEELEIPFPSEDEQEKIANILGSLDDKIELNRQMNQTLEAMAHAIFKSWFVDFDPVYAKMEGRDYPLPPEIMDLFPDELEESELGLIPKGWRVEKISDVCETKYGYTASAENFETGPKFLRITDIVNSGINWDTVPYCKIVEKDLNNYLLTEGDIVVARTGATVGYGKRLGKRIPISVFASYLVRFRPLKKELIYFIGIQVESNTYKQFIKQNIQGSAQPQANAKILSSYTLITPTEPLLNKFNIVVKPFLEKKEINDLQNEKLIKIRDILLPTLISGELEEII